jgi:hypothetical protein
MIFTLQAYGAGSSLTIQDAMVKKGNSGATEMEFTVYHSISAPMPVTIYYSTMDDSAKAGIDYVAKNGTVMIKPNERTTSIVVPVINNLKPTKNNKQFKVSIASSTTVTKPIAIGTILENDTQPTSAAADKNLSVTKGDSRETRK